MWARSPDPRAHGETAVIPDWTLRVLPDGSVEPYLPGELRFRDGPQVRPVSPFFEVWVRLGENGSDPSTWRDAPLTPALLAAQGTNLTALVVTVDARNAKAARRTGQPQLVFGTFPAVHIRGDYHAPVPLYGTSPPASSRPMIPLGRGIPLGSVQLLRSRMQPTERSWSEVVNVETVRLRFTPAKGLIFGPPAAAETTPLRPFPAVPVENAFLDPSAGWFGASDVGAYGNPDAGRVEPSDTYDGAEAPGESGRVGPSLGVIDDTCEARIQVTLTVPGSPELLARANVFVGPPDFAPDRRPFLSLADELNDRAGDATERSAALTGVALDQWVEDLFERVFETIYLFNVDWYRTRRAATVPSDKLRAMSIPGDKVSEPGRAMGGRDPLRSPEFTILDPTTNEPLPLSEHARTRHRALSDVLELRAFVQRHPGRVKELVRRAFEIEANEGAIQTTMRMPPFMRQSNAQPLTLASWQYDLLMRWVEETERAAAAKAPAAASGVAASSPVGQLSSLAQQRREDVLERLAREANKYGEGDI
ncbi:hypothetical protein MicloDRAFT_00001470 [Microvirga lotononidis]|uniref:Uncharacterized protein n=1 Tax=Microvirga lotononidis TaxID=864069 RepID=I4Z4L5_9HYPH|nr:hypothetical protein MicloDRAFT_00001470 [Microvirga lotononidis]